MKPRRGCLDLESIAAFAEGKLPHGERRQVEAHLASCEECSAMLAGAVLFREAEVEKGPAPARISPGRIVGIAAALVVATLVGAYAWKELGARRETIRGVGPLVAVKTDGRSIDARITGGFPWVPLEPVERSGAGPRASSPYELLAAAAQVEKDAGANPTPESRHALGVARLVVGDLDGAIAVLRTVVSESTAKGKSLSDLGAALLARGEMKGRPDDLIEALSCIDKALQADASLQEALFNRAVALEKLHLDDQAESAWNEYLAQGAEPGWTEEARERVEKIRSARESSEWDPDQERIEQAAARGDRETVLSLVALRTQETRYWVQDELLVVWARAANEGRTADSERALALSETLAEALRVATGDPMLRDIVTALRASTAPETSIRGYLAYANGVDLYQRDEKEKAKSRFEEAAGALRTAGNPMELFASYAAARCEHFQFARQDELARLRRILVEAERSGYLALIAHVSWLRGLADLTSSQLGEAVANYQKSLRLFTQIHEEEHVAFVSALLAEAHGFLGEEVEAERKTLESLAHLGRVRSSSRRSAILLFAAIAVRSGGFSDVALRIQDVAVHEADQRGEAADIVEAHLGRASLGIDLARIVNARSDLSEARLWVVRVEDAGIRGRLDAEIRLVDARMARLEQDPDLAVALLTESIERFSRTKFDVRLPALYLERARASRAGGNATAAERDLRLGIDVLERHRPDILQTAQRVSYFDTGRDLFDEIVSLEAARGNADAALALLERGKTRDLLDRWQRTPHLDVAALARELPAQVVVIAYGMLPDRLLVWTLSDRSREVIEMPIRAEELTGLVRALREEIEKARGTKPLEAAERLYEVLIAPIAPRIAGVKTLVFVPDEALHALPFAALADAKTSRFLVEDHPIVVAPSIALFLHATRRAGGDEPKAPRSILVVGDPAFDTSAFPNLSRLPAAASEAKRIAALYPESTLLTDAAATRSAFLQALGRQSVVHFAGHALTSDVDLLNSRLVLAPDRSSDDQGTLFAEKLYDTSFGKVRLVVLAACATASGRISRGEGPLSIARPFLAGGVPSVVATLWEIEDAPSAELLTAFHRALVAGSSPVDALREAQVAMIEGGDPALRLPRAWAAFEVMGGLEKGAPRT